LHNTQCANTYTKCTNTHTKCTNTFKHKDFVVLNLWGNKHLAHPSCVFLWAQTHTRNRHAKQIRTHKHSHTNTHWLTPTPTPTLAPRLQTKKKYLAHPSCGFRWALHTLSYPQSPTGDISQKIRSTVPANSDIYIRFCLCVYTPKLASWFLKMVQHTLSCHQSPTGDISQTVSSVGIVKLDIYIHIYIYTYTYIYISIDI